MVVAPRTETCWAEDRAHGELERVPGARNANARMAGQRIAQEGIRAQAAADGGIGSEVEHRADAVDNRGDDALVGKVDLNLERRRERRDFDQTTLVADRDRAPIATGICGLHPKCGADSETLSALPSRTAA
jgi:hypothetical protein